LSTKPPEVEVPEPPREPGAELEKVQQYVQLWRLRARLEVVMLGVIGVFAVSVAVAFVILDLGEDDITGAWGYPILWIISLLRASSVLLPIPGSGLTIAAGAVMDPLWGIPVPIAVGVTAGSAESLGEFTGYYAGINGGKLMEGRRLYETVRRWIQKAPFWTMLAMSFTPSPMFDVAGLAAGAARVPIRIFYPAVLLGKVARGILMAAAGYWGIGVIEAIFELDFVSDLLDSTAGKIAVAAIAVVVIAAAIFIIRRFRAQIARLLE
jgi:uncharacterized membrane protein YdjX (TVP38/TMEM64 family)